MVLAVYGFLYQSRSQASSVWDTRFWWWTWCLLPPLGRHCPLYKLSSAQCIGRLQSRVYNIHGMYLRVYTHLLRHCYSVILKPIRTSSFIN